MHDPQLQEILNDIADVTDRMGPVLRSPALDVTILDIMTENVERLLTQLYRVKMVLLLSDN